jgi:hypothetical protein
MSFVKKYQVGDLRPSQLLLAYGVGAVIDLPHMSALVMGLDDWNTQSAEEIVEPRLLQAIQSVMGPRVQRLLSPPIDESNQQAFTQVGVPVAAFPRWMVCPTCHLLAPVDAGFFQLRANPYHPERTCYRHINCSKAKVPPIVVPSRFIVACEAGHLDDFPWHHFVHGDRPCKSVLHMNEIGVSGEPSSIRITCQSCNANRSMRDAFASDEAEEGRTYHPHCSGHSPHLRKFARKKCQYQARTTLLSASNTWFPLVYTTLSLPEADDILGQLIEEHWSIFQAALNIDMVRAFMLLPMLKYRVGSYSAEAIWQRIEAKKQETPASVKPGDLKQPEWEVLSNPLHAPHTDDFEVVPADVPEGYSDQIQQVVLVERLREVRALTGFTRIESLSDYAEDEELPKDHIMKLANKTPEWVPAAEVRGEGIFIQFREDALQDWLRKTVVQRHNDMFRDAHRRWREARHLDNPEANYPELRYVLLHTFAHALMRQLTLESGYAAASIRERIYAAPPTAEGGPMAGILLYTAASDSEGTLGGLVHLGRQLGFHIDGALDDMQYCASDPLCAEHVSLDDNTLHGSACHACMFVPETSCERGNRYLDRSLLIRTVERDDLAFFPKIFE